MLTILLIFATSVAPLTENYESFLYTAINRELRVVRDKGVNQKVNEESRIASQTNFDQVAPDYSAKR